MTQDAIPLTSQNLAFAEERYEAWLRDPSSVDEEWAALFADLAEGDGVAPAARSGPSFRPKGLFATPTSNEPPTPRQFENRVLQDRVDQLVRAFRVRGHMVARLDPLGRPRHDQVELDPSFYRLEERDLDRRFSSATIAGGGIRTLREMLSCLRNTYCRSIGVQFMHIDDLRVKNWLQERMESTQNRMALSRALQLRILERLTDAVVFEEFIQKKYVGAKSFSLEGAETLIPLLDLTLEQAGEEGVEEVILGMAHRGRLNVLANVMGKSPAQIFREFDDSDHDRQRGRGDVKYHLGFSGDRVTSSGKTLHLSLCFNPSHLEFVNTVAEGRMRAKQDRFDDPDGRRGLVVLIHGDAAFAGEGVVQEMLNMSQLPAHRIGGTIHVIVNNQIGFTTSPEEGRSCTYATDVAKMLQIPIFHVNGEDPEAVAQVVRLAMDFRRTFGTSVVIDMYGYRRHGHNEGDEPSFTQPALYEAIRQRKSVRRGYVEHLAKLGEVTEEEADDLVAKKRRELESLLATARSDDYARAPSRDGWIWSRFRGGPDAETPEVDTGVEAGRLTDLLRKTTVVPDGFQVHPKIGRLMTQRLEMAAGGRPLDWAAAEAVAWATLVTEGCGVRLCGQDSERGTFSHRHAVLHDVRGEGEHRPLAHLSDRQARFEAYNSCLSEAGVLGFEYGYSLDYPEGLVMWEAQFGDFCNAAQVIIDQFIASAEDKWNRLSGLVLLLPHGFEGMGPEHSSARLERFLMLAAEDNMQIANFTTPAQYFHALRRQVLRPWRKPLVIMTPKSLLRHPGAVSTLDELTGGSFQKVIEDPAVSALTARRVLLCSGKIYYELLAKRDELDRRDVAIVRLELLYPFPKRELAAALEGYADGTPVYWVQEEPENMGAWRYLLVRAGVRLFGRFPLRGIAREESASPATPSATSHRLEQDEILTQAFQDTLGS